jgi:predicted nucleotidyltransferase
MSKGIDTPQTAFDELSSRLGEEWPSIRAGRDEARQRTLELRGYVAALKPPANTSVVGFGSLAREEWTSGSDLDWTLLIDGPTDMGHFGVTTDVETLLKEKGFVEPGPTGTFGSMASSHQLVHEIGGLEDTNQNITRRVLLLLESVSLSDSITHERVVRAILQRYIVGDPPTTSPSRFHAPLFLLNDIVRFWRTLTVDYAAKKWQRSNVGFAIRNVKLRMSRKLLFAKGLLLCFLCDEEFAGVPKTTLIEEELVNLCFATSRRTAIDLMAETLSRHADAGVARQLMGAYERFLSTMRDPESREKLKKLEFEDAADSFFETQRRTTREFRDALEKLFFESNVRLAELIRRYGVF